MERCNREKVYMMQGYILIALGKVYIDEAVLAAKSIRKQGDPRPINILIRSEDEQYAKDKDSFTDITIFEPVSDFYDQCKVGFEKFGTYPKINLIHYSRYDENIFIDTDVLCQYNADSLWEYLRGRDNDVAMMGTKTDPSWHWGTINEVSAAFGKDVPHIHGGFLYFRKTSVDFFEFCDKIAYRYDDLKCKRFYKGGMCDEIIFALAHSNFDYDPIEFDRYPIMTFNYGPDIDLPSRLQTHNNTILEDYIPFIHVYDRSRLVPLFKRITQ